MGYVYSDRKRSLELDEWAGGEGGLARRANGRFGFGHNSRFEFGLKLPRVYGPQTAGVTPWGADGHSVV